MNISNIVNINIINIGNINIQSRRWVDPLTDCRIFAVSLSAFHSRLHFHSLLNGPFTHHSESRVTRSCNHPPAHLEVSPLAVLATDSSHSIYVRHSLHLASQNQIILTNYGDSRQSMTFSDFRPTRGNNQFTWFRPCES